MFLTEIEPGVRKELDDRIASLQHNTAWAVSNNVWARVTSYVNTVTPEDWSDYEKQIQDKLTSKRTGRVAHERSEHTGRVSSGLGGVKSDSTLREQHVLYSGNYSTFTSTYDTDKHFAVPSLQSIDVQYKGQFGSSKRSTIKFSLYHISQLDIYEKLYMSPGKTLFVEWGLTLDANGNTLNLPPIAKPVSDFERKKYIEDLRKQYSYNYDGFQGRIVNFSWTYTGQLYDCTVEIASIGDMIFDTGTKFGPGTQVDDIEKGTTSIFSNFKTKIWEMYKYAEQNQYDFKQAYQLGNWIAGTFIVHGKEDREVDEKYFDTGNSSERYVRLYSLFEMTNECFSDIHKYKINTSDVVLIPYHRAIVSCDPYICIIPGQSAAASFLANELLTGNGLDSYSFPAHEIDGEYYGSLGDIGINLVYLFNLCDSTETLAEFYKQLLSDVSDCFGGICDLVLNEDKNNPEYSIIEDNNILAHKQINAYLFTNKSLLLHEVSTTTRLTDAMKTMALYGNVPSTVSYNTGGSGQIAVAQRLGDNLVDVANPIDFLDSVYSNDIDTKEDSVWIKYVKAVGALHTSRTPESVASCKTALRSYLRESSDDDPYKDTYGPKQRVDVRATPWPLDLTITIDGLSGLKFGDSIMYDWIPTRYKDLVVFQIKQLHHTITNTGWTLVIETLCRVNPLI